MRHHCNTLDNMSENNSNSRLDDAYVEDVLKLGTHETALLNGYFFPIEAGSEVLHRLCNVAEYFITKSVNIKELNVNQEALKNYINSASILYNNITPFHNFHHALTVLNSTIQLTKLITSDADFKEKCEGMDTIATFTVFICALVHDVQHTGNTNAFEINSGTALAKKYECVSVLENHHIATALQLLELPGCDITAGMTEEHAEFFKKHMALNILATDMSIHFTLVNKLKEDHLCNKKVSMSFLTRVILHTADLSSPTKDFHIAKGWSTLINQEFKKQYDNEIALGLPTLPHMNTSSELEIYQQEIPFVRHVVLPLWDILADIFPAVQAHVDSINANLILYQKEIDNQVAAMNKDVNASNDQVCRM